MVRHLVWIYAEKGNSDQTGVGLVMLGLIKGFLNLTDFAVLLAALSLSDGSGKEPVRRPDHFVRVTITRSNQSLRSPPRFILVSSRHRTVGDKWTEPGRARIPYLSQPVAGPLNAG